jgi:hypothetical protein
MIEFTFKKPDIKDNVPMSLGYTIVIINICEKIKK